jgi:hypothetical protein
VIRPRGPVDDRGGAPEPLQLKEAAGTGGHQVDYYASQVQQAPFVIGIGSSGTVKYLEFLFADEIFYMPLQSLEMGIACHRGDNEKVCPEIQGRHVHDNYFLAVVILKKPAQFQGTSA